MLRIILIFYRAIYIYIMFVLYDIMILYIYILLCMFVR